MFTISILWYLSLPVVIYLSYKIIAFTLKKFENK